MTHKEILEALSGLLLAMFVAMLSSTVVTNALPRIVTDLHGSQTGYTWVIVATMLAMTATTPIWGKLADLFAKKTLMLVALTVYMLGSALAGVSQSMEMLIGARVLTGVGVGGVMALIQIIIATMVSPRERGRYAGYIGASFGLATLSGPLIGGMVVDSPLGWRGCFYVALPFAIASFLLLRAKLHLPVVKRQVQIDYLGAVLLMGGVSLLLIWVSLAGHQFDWLSPATVLMVAGGLVLLALAVLVEARVAPEPIIPLFLFKDRTMVLATIATISVGIAMFGATTFLSEYFQTSRGMSPTAAGLMSLCMVGGLMVLGIVSGKAITDTGRWKGWLVGGMAVAVLGTVLLATIDAHTSLWAVGAYMAVLGCGLGATQQNLLLAVQNNVDQANIGAASSLVNFFRSMGGAVGVSALGAVLAHDVTSDVTSGVAKLVAQGTLRPEDVGSLGHGAVPDVAALPGPLRTVFENAFGDATGHIFVYTVPFALVALIAVCFIKETRLRTSLSDLSEPEIDMELAAELEAGGGGRR